MNILATPYTLSPAYNPNWVYGTSSAATTEQNFSYRLFINRLLPNELLTARTFIPSPNGLLETDLNRLLSSGLTDLTDDININDNNNIFNNTPMSGFGYNLLTQERYLDTWEFTGATTSPFFDDQVVLIGPEQSTFQTGDVVTVTGLATTFEYSSITQGVNNYARINLTSPHNLSTGDFVFIQQNSPFCFPLYSGLVEVLIATDPNFIVINKLWQGPCQFAQTGKVILNPELDGTAVVVITGGSSPNFEVMINKSTTTLVGGTFSGTVRYADSRLKTGRQVISDNQYVFNGAVAHNQWDEWDWTEYSPITNDFKFLTDLPDNWVVRPVNDIYLNYFTGNLTQIYSYLLLEYGNDTYQVVYDGPATYSTIQTINVGPNQLNKCRTIELIPAEQVIFNEQGTYGLTSTGSGNVAITNGQFVYSSGIGVGRGDLSLSSVLTPGFEYTVTFDVDVNIGCEVNITSLGVVVTAGQTGTFTGTFTATGTNFVFRVDSTSSLSTIEVDNLSITYELCNVIDCSPYTISVLHRLQDVRNVIIPFEFADQWVIATAGNAKGTIDNGIAEYEEITPLGGGGLVTFVQDDRLTIGGNYTFSINITNNSECSVFLGPFGDVTLIATTNQTGVITGSFLATNEGFAIAVLGTGVLNGLTMRDLTVTGTDEFVRQSERRTFDVDCSCTGRYINKPMLFLDRMGSVLPVNWTVNHIEMVEIKRQGHKKFIGGLDLSKPGHSYTPQMSSYRQYDTTATEEWELISDWMTEEQSLFLEQTMTSPVVYIRVDRQYIPCRVTDVKYDRVYKRNKKMISHRMNVIINNENNIQTG